MEKIDKQLNTIKQVEDSVINKDIETLRSVQKTVNSLPNFTFGEKLIAAHAFEMYYQHLLKVRDGV